ncbi:hypothetical protein Tco_1437011 [Tanacetum coccineum]
MARQSTKPKRPRNSAWFKQKVMLGEALESGEIPTPTAFHTDDLDTYDSDCDEAPSASTVLIAKLSSYDSEAISELPTPNNSLDNHVNNKIHVALDLGSTEDTMIVFLIEAGMYSESTTAAGAFNNKMVYFEAVVHQVLLIGRGCHDRFINAASIVGYYCLMVLLLFLLDTAARVIMVNVIPPDHDHDVPVVEPNQHDDVPVVPEPVLEDEDEDPEEDEFEEEEDPQEDEDDMEIDIEEDENEPELTYPYEEVDPLNPPPPASESKPDDEIEVENPVEQEDETIPVSVYEVGESSTTAIPLEDGDRLLPGLMRRDIDYLFGRMVNFLRRLFGEYQDGACIGREERIGKG